MQYVATVLFTCCLFFFSCETATLKDETEVDRISFIDAIKQRNQARKYNLSIAYKPIALKKNIGKNISSNNITENTRRTKNNKGVEQGVWWLTSQHAEYFFVSNGNKSRPNADNKLYGDWWFVREFQKAIEKLRAVGVVGVSHYGLYYYRNIAGSHRLSRHSHGLAFDITGFYMEDKQYIQVARGWKTQSQLPTLKKIKEVLCEVFDVVLTPESNRSHWDHFHIDLDPKRRPEETKKEWLALEEYDKKLSPETAVINDIAERLIDDEHFFFEVNENFSGCLKGL